MVERVRQAMRKLGTRRAVLDTCPVCGGSITAGHDRVRVWNGKLAHSECASYHRRRRDSQRVHDSFTAA